jgi:hypothetical protein
MLIWVEEDLNLIDHALQAGGCRSDECRRFEGRCRLDLALWDVLYCQYWCMHARVIYYCLRREGTVWPGRPLAARLTTVKTQWPRTEPLGSASRFLLLHVAFTWYAARKDSAMCNQSTVLLLLFSCTLYMSSFP